MSTLKSIKSDQPIKTIAFLFAMYEEALPLLTALSLVGKETSFDSYLPMQIYTTVQNGMTIYIVFNGFDDRYIGLSTYKTDNVATQPAAVSALSTINKIQPDIIFNVGSAGYISPVSTSLSMVKKVFISSGDLYYYDRNTYLPTTQYGAYGLGNYPCLNAPNLASYLGISTCVVGTSNSMPITSDEWKIVNQLKATVFDMEAAAIAWMCYLYDTPFIAIKGITNMVGDPSQSSTSQNEPISGDNPLADFIKTLNEVAKILSKKSLMIIEFCSGKTISEL